MKRAEAVSLGERINENFNFMTNRHRILDHLD